ncbi:MAG: type II toxin-antitoxin system VapB family antitoxin [Candidatus Melainabacteria bacterium]|nr:MAG: type II toxin-antitoxin system VapB family antitoxin [Candidatus Melainabacteria bacterium]
MSMNIKNEEAHELAKELAALSGQSITTVVTVALREKLERTKRDSSIGMSDQLLAIGRRFSEQVKQSKFKILTDDDLYDEMGLPK